MPAWGNCLLVAMALHKYVAHPFTDSAAFKYSTFIDDVVAAVKFADIVSRSNSDRHPYPEQQEMDKRSRRIGIEPTGLADCLAMMGYQYGSEESIDFIRNLFAEKAFAELYASMEIARDGVGKAPVFKEDPLAINRFMHSPYMRNLRGQECEYVEKYLITRTALIDDILKYGLAHTAFNTAGPCGSISIMADNCTSGIEPLYAWEYERKTRLSDETYKIRHLPAVLFGGTKDHYVEAHELSWRDRIKVQAAVQEFTDSSISSTINLPEDATVDEIEQIYIEAWKSGLKGITIFRDNCKEGVLSVGTKQPIQVEEGPSIPVMYKKTLLPLEDAKRHMVVWKGAKVYIIVSLDSEDAPIEIFAKLPRKAGINKDGFFEQARYNEMVANWDCITRQASTMLRYNIPMEEVLHQLEESSCSIVDAPGVIHRVLRQYLPDIIEEGEDPEDDCGATGGTEEVKNETHSTFRTKREICRWCGNPLEGKKGSKLCARCEVELPYSERVRINGTSICPECGGDHYYRENGCRICKDCGFSKC